MSKQKIQLSDHFNYSRLLRFVLPCVGTMLFTSIYGIVDGLCVSNFVGKTAFAAVNLIMPVPMLVGSVGFMLGTGGSAIVGITLVLSMIATNDMASRWARATGKRPTAISASSSGRPSSRASSSPLSVFSSSARRRRCWAQRARCWTTPSGMAAS